MTGVLEVAGGALVLWPSTVVRGAGLLACVTVGAVHTHLVLVGGSPVPALAVAALALARARLRRPGAA